MARKEWPLPAGFKRRVKGYNHEDDGKYTWAIPVIVVGLWTFIFYVVLLIDSLF